MRYYPITQDMRDAGLFGPYLDYVGPYPTAAIRDAEQAKAQQHASRILKARATRRSPMPDTKLFYYYTDHGLTILCSNCARTREDQGEQAQWAGSIEEVIHDIVSCYDCDRTYYQEEHDWK
jgi:hypothetical protein